MEINRKRVARRLASGLVAGALALGGLAISGGSVSAKTPAAQTTKRLAGDDRYETAVEIARDAIENTNLSGNAVKDYLIIASGEKPYDALSAAGLAGTLSAPIVLTPSDSLHPAVADLLSDYYVNYLAGGPSKGVYIVGGTSAISDEVKAAVEALIQTGDSTPAFVTRIAGADRYATAAAINAVPGVLDASDRIIVVNGEDGRWPDALSASMLASEKGWPIVPVQASSIPAASAGTIDAYMGKAGSQEKSLLVGGPAVLTQALREALVVEHELPVSKMQSIGGADRYQTNFLANVYASALGQGAADFGAFGSGDTVGLVSGEAPWDALAASGWNSVADAHLVMTPSAAFGQATLFATLATVAQNPDDMYIMGGKSAVSDAVRTAAIAAAQSTNLAAPVLSGCVEGSTKIKMTFAKALSAAEETDIAAEIAITGSGVIDAGSSGLAAAGLGTNASADKVYEVVLSTALAEDDVFEFDGLLETDGDKARVIPGAECEVADDTTRPSVTSFVLYADDDTAGADAVDYGIISFSEPVTFVDADGATAGTQLDSSVCFTADDFQPAGDTVTATQMDLAGQVFKLVDTATPVAALDVDDVATINTNAVGCVKDLGGLATLQANSTTVEVDEDKPSFVVAATECTTDGAADASATVGGLVVSAVSTANGGAYGGVVGNGWKVVVAQSRGLLIPMVAIDATAKTITVTADVGYHKAADVAQVAHNNAAIWGNFAVSSTGTGALSASTGKALTGGDIDCMALLAGSEGVAYDATDDSFVVNGYNQSAKVAVAAGGSIAANYTILLMSGVEHAGAGQLVVDVSDGAATANTDQVALTINIG